MGSSVHGSFQARVLEWIAVSFPRRPSRPRNRTQVSLIAGRLFTIWATREAQIFIYLAAPDRSCSTQGLVAQPGFEPGSPALGVQSLSCLELKIMSYFSISWFSLFQDGWSKTLKVSWLFLFSLPSKTQNTMALKFGGKVEHLSLLLLGPEAIHWLLGQTDHFIHMCEFIKVVLLYHILWLYMC